MENAVYGAVSAAFSALFHGMLQKQGVDSVEHAVQEGIGHNVEFADILFDIHQPVGFEQRQTIIQCSLDTAEGTMTDAELDAALQTFAVEKVAGVQAHIVRMVAHVEQLHQLIVIDGQDSAGDHFLMTFAGIFLLQAFNFLPVVFHLLLKLLQIRCRKLQLLPCLQLLILFVQRLDFSFMIFSVRFELLQKETVLLKLYLQLFRFLLVGLRIQLLLEISSCMREICFGKLSFATIRMQ